MKLTPLHVNPWNIYYATIMFAWVLYALLTFCVCNVSVKGVSGVVIHIGGLVSEGVMFVWYRF